jgi:hypothetical protein
LVTISKRIGFIIIPPTVSSHSNPMINQVSNARFQG